MAEAITALHPAPRVRVQAMKEYHPPLGYRDSLRLDFNENTLACSPKVREVLAAVSAGALTRYPEREPVEAFVAAQLGLSAEQVALTNGVDEAIHVLFEAFLEAGDELLLPVPTYTMYEVYASATDARVVTVQAEDDLQFPFRATAECDHTANEDCGDCQSEQPFGVGGHARADSGTCAAGAAGRGPGGRGLFSFPRRDGDGFDWDRSESDSRAHFFESLWLGRVALGTACRASRVDALGAPGALALQRESAGAGGDGRRRIPEDWYVNEASRRG